MRPSVSRIVGEGGRADSEHGIRVVALHAEGTKLRKAPAWTLTLRAGHGALGDRHAGRDPDRAVLVTSSASYDHLRERGLDLPHGTLGENLVLGGLVVERLAVGTMLHAGPISLQVTAPCTVCSSLSVVDPRLPKLAYGRRGVYVRVVQGGVIGVGDRVRVGSAPA